MTRELDRNTSIHRLFESAGRSIPDLDGHNIRVAERRILWSKIAQLPPSVTPQQVAAWEAAQAAPAPLMPPSATPEQVAAWERAQAQPQPGQELTAPQPSSVTEQQLAQLTRQLATRPQTGAAHVQRPAAPVAPTGAAHVQRQAPRPAAPAPAAPPAAAPMFDLRQTMQSPTGIMPQLPYTPGPGDPNYVPPAPVLNYTPGPFDANYTGASKNIQGLLKVADYLSKKKS